MQEKSYKIKSEEEKELFCRSFWPEGELMGAVQILHGYGEHSGRYKELARFLTSKNLAVFAHDHLGHGQSDGLRTHVDSFYEYIYGSRNVFEKILLEIEPDTPLFLLGHSMGSIIALNYLLLYQEDYNGAVLSGTGESLAGEKDFGVKIVNFLGLVFPRGRFEFPLPPSFISRDEKIIKEYKEDPLVEKDLTYRLGREMNLSLQKIREDLDSVNLPVLIQVGEEDQSFTGVERLYQKLGSKNKTLKVYPELRHEVYNEMEPERTQVLEDLWAWLEEQIKLGGDLYA